VVVVVEVVLGACALVASLVGKRVVRLVRALVLRRRWVSLSVVLVNDTRRSRVLQVLRRLVTLLLVVGMMRVASDES
jgi:chromate transport protein ChrA